MEKRLLEKFGIYFDIKIWNIEEALKHKGTIDYKYALLFILDTLLEKEAKEILRNLKKEKKFQRIIYKIELYNADLESYQKLKNEEERQMKLEDVAEAYKKEGIAIGEKNGIIKTAISMLKEGVDISLVKKITGLSKKEILKFQSNINSL